MAESREMKANQQNMPAILNNCQSSRILLEQVLRMWHVSLAREQEPEAAHLFLTIGHQPISECTPVKHAPEFPQNKFLLAYTIINPGI
jgi:hypothetical protein